MITFKLVIDLWYPNGRFKIYAFQGVSFRIDEVELDSELRRIYNKSVELWVEMLHKFTEAADLIDAEKKMKKTIGQKIPISQVPA